MTVETALFPALFPGSEVIHAARQIEHAVTIYAAIISTAAR